jgi:hypothetical protein
MRSRLGGKWAADPEVVKSCAALGVRSFGVRAPCLFPGGREDGPPARPRAGGALEHVKNSQPLRHRRGSCGCTRPMWNLRRPQSQIQHPIDDAELCPDAVFEECDYAPRPALRRPWGFNFAGPLRWVLPARIAAACFIPLRTEPGEARSARPNSAIRAGRAVTSLCRVEQWR